MKPTTTFLRRKSDMKREPLPNCHDGEGALDWSEVLDTNTPAGGVLFFHDNIMAPGVSCGVHTHTDTWEYYYILSGEGVLTLDGVEHEVGPGDIAGVYAGGSHGLLNTGSDDIRFLVVAGQEEAHR